MQKLINGAIPSPMACPYCKQGTVRSPDDKTPAILTGPEFAVCPHCHSIAMEQYGQLRPLLQTEFARIDWAEWRKTCAELVDHFGPAKHPCKTPPPASLLRH